MLVSNNSRRNESLLEILELKHKTITTNIANADTPGFKAKSVEFEEALAQQINRKNSSTVELNRTHANHLPHSTSTGIIPYKIVEQPHTTMNNNLNNVDIDKEMVSLAENQLAYNFMIGKVSGHYNKYKKLLSDLT